MSLSASFGQRLRLARLAAGLSLRQLAAAIDHAVSAQAIGQYERGRMLPGSSTALRLAQALAVPLGYLMSPLRLRLQAVEFLRHGALSPRQYAQVEAAVLEHVDRYVQVESLLNVLRLPWQAPAATPYPVTTLADAELAAARVRRDWGLGSGPLAALTEECERRGLKVLQVDFPLLVDGLSCQVPHPDNAPIPVIVVSARVPPERQRLVMAHELGHMLLAVGDPARLEAACDRFAGAFLVPAEPLRDHLGLRRHAFGYEEIMDIARLFGVTAVTVLDRLADLHVIGAGTRRRMQGVIERAPVGTALPVDSERPRRFQRLVLRALAEGALAEAKAVELLAVSTTELARRMAGMPDAAG